MQNKSQVTHLSTKFTHDACSNSCNTRKVQEIPLQYNITNVKHREKTIKKTKVTDCSKGRKVFKELSKSYQRQHLNIQQYKLQLDLSVEIKQVCYEVNGTSELPPAFEYWTTSKQNQTQCEAHNNEWNTQLCNRATRYSSAPSRNAWGVYRCQQPPLHFQTQQHPTNKTVKRAFP